LPAAIEARRGAFAKHRHVSKIAYAKSRLEKLVARPSKAACLNSISGPPVR